MTIIGLYDYNKTIIYANLTAYNAITLLIARGAAE